MKATNVLMLVADHEELTCEEKHGGDYKCIHRHYGPTEYKYFIDGKEATAEQYAGMYHWLMSVKEGH